MLKNIDAFLNGITMYRLVLYALLFVAGTALVLSAGGLLAFSLFSLCLSLSILILVAYASNYFFARLLRAPVNAESAPITGLILFLILTPAIDGTQALVLAGAAVIAMASKYVVAWNKRHLFNPAAFSAVALGLFQVGGASWWVGSPALLPATILVGSLIVRKIRRAHLVITSVLVSFAAVIVYGVALRLDLGELLIGYIGAGHIIFFSTVMLTEPLTTPPTRRLQIIYGALVGVLSNVPFVLWRFYGSPELGLLMGNLFSYCVSLRERLVPRLKERRQIARDTYEFIFSTTRPFAFQPGQYLEWTLPHKQSDTRGIRRFFTIASSPSEKELRLGVKIAEHASSFKQTLKALPIGATVFAGQRGGDFVLPQNKAKKLVFMAGGIGITPFRSMVQYLLDANERRNIILFYSVKAAKDIAYQSLFDEAARIGVKTVYVLTEERESALRSHETEISETSIKKHIPDYTERVFYLSGPEAMVEHYKKLLRAMGVSRRAIMTDYFPGYA